MYKLTKGALQKMVNGIYVHEPVLQVLNYGKSSNDEEYKLVLFDLKELHFSVILSVQLNSLITNNILTKYSICQIKEYALKHTEGGLTLMILSLDIKVDGNKVGGKVDSRLEELPVLQVVQPSTSDTNISTIPIRDINPFCKNLVIKAKVYNKFPIKKWYGANGSGQMFCMDLQDDSGEIRCAAFNKECDKFFDMVTAGKVYYFSKVLVKVAKQVIKNKYELVLLRYSKIVLFNEKGPSNLVFNFTSLSDLNKKWENDTVDVLAIIKSCGDVQRVVGRNGETTIREIELSDKGNTTIKFTLWDSYATTFSGTSGQILAIKGARIRNYNTEKVLSTIVSTVLEIDPDIPEAHNLQI